MSGAPLLSVSELFVHFPMPGGQVRAVDGVSLNIQRSETVALVGESGCGKSTLARAVVGIQRPSSGQVSINGTDVHLELQSNAVRRKALRRQMQMIFQDPDASLNPRMTLGAAIAEPMQIHLRLEKSALQERVSELLAQVGLAPELRHRYPHELSGGQRQRVCIARALAVAPELLVCDEVTSALDVSVQAQILNLLAELRETFGLSYLFITHDLAVVRQLSDRVFVMYLGQVMESGPTHQVLDAPEHPYTRALIAAVPRIGGRHVAQKEHVAGDVPSPTHPPAGCRFHTRCSLAEARCSAAVPRLVQLGQRQVRCVLSEPKPQGNVSARSR
jgi:oligopeptide/dipeptide ABC transporter ATP-binding protein